MRENKRKRLKARGWKVGSAKDFLGLNDQEAAFIELKTPDGKLYNTKPAAALRPAQPGAPNGGAVPSADGTVPAPKPGT